MKKLLRKTGRLIIALTLVLFAMMVTLNGSALGVSSVFADDSQMQEEGVPQENLSPDISEPAVEGATDETQAPVTETVSNSENQSETATPVDNGQILADTVVPTKDGEVLTDTVVPTEDGAVLTENTASAESGEGQTDTAASTESSEGQTDTAASTESGEEQPDTAASTESGEEQIDTAASTESGEEQPDTAASTESGEEQTDTAASTESGEEQADTAASTESGEEQTDTAVSTESGEEQTDTAVSTESGEKQTDTAASTVPSAEGEEQTDAAFTVDGEGQVMPEFGGARMLMRAAPVALTAAPDSEEEPPSVLQSMINDAMKSVSGTLSGKLQVVLSKDTTYDGDVTVSSDGYTVADDFALELTTEDAGDDGLQADGSATFTGNLFIKSIAVILKGLNMPGKVEVSGENGSLDYYGSAQDDTVNVTVTDQASAAIYTGAGDDTVTVYANYGGGADIDTGNGDDTVNATVSAGGSAAVETGAGSDTVNLDVHPGSGGAAVATGADDDTVSVKNGGDVSENRFDEITVDLGDGVNKAEIDLSLADAAEKISVRGDEGSSNSLNLTGKLKKDEDNDDYNPISGTEESMALTAESGKVLTLTTANVGTLTDALVNKLTKTLTAKDGSFSYQAKLPFTNYVIKVPNGELKQISIHTDEKLPLSAVVIDTDSVAISDNRLTIGKDANVLVRGLKLILRAREIEIDGKLQADYVLIEATDGTGAHGRSFGDLYSAYNESENFASAAFDAGLDMAAELINVNNKASIVIGKNAAIYSAGDVVLRAQVEQSGGMLSFLSGINLVNVKLAEAVIDIAGKIYAGYDFDAGVVSGGSGSVTAEALTGTSIGYDADGKELSGLPLAISVALADAQVNVAQGAEIHAAQDIALNAKSELKIYTRADSGVLSSVAPVALAVSVLTNDATARVDGMLKAGRNIAVTAYGDVKATGIADKGESHDNASGGFISVAVVLQDAIAELGEHANVTAGGDILVLSTAKENVDNRASSATQDIEKSDEGVFGEVKKQGIKLLTDKVLPWLKEKAHGWFHSDEYLKTEKLTQAVSKITSSDKSIQVDDAAEKHADIKIDLKSSTDQADHSTEYPSASVTIKPHSGYKVKTVWWRGYNPGDSSYQVQDISDSNTSDGKYLVQIQKQNITLFVEYETDDGTAVVDELDGIWDSQPSGDADNLDLEELLNDVQNSSDDETSESAEDIIARIENEDDADDEQEPSAELKLSGEGGGAVLNYRSDPDDKSKSCLKVLPGEELRLIPNPSVSKALKQGGLTAVYKIKEDDKEVTKTVVINADEKGRYLFTVPEDMILTAGLTIKAEFVDSGSSNAEADTTQTQLTGAIAVVVADNDANTVIADGASAIAGGSVTADSSVKTDIKNIADGMAVSKDGASSGSSDANYGIKRDGSKQYSGYDAEGRQYSLVVETTGQGSVTPEAIANVNNAYTFKVSPESGYTVAGVTLVYYKDGKRQTSTLTAGSDGKYTVNLNSISGLDKGSIAQVSVAFAKNGETVTESGASRVSAVIPNPIKISYNGLKQGKGSDETFVEIGKIYYKKATTNADGSISGYVFESTAKATYLLDGKLKASWKDLSGAMRTVELQKNSDGLWVLDPSAIPTGALITVSAAFKDDFHAFETTGTIANGTVTLYDEQIKATDKPKIAVKADAGYSVEEITVTYTGRDGTSTTTKLTLSGHSIAQVKDKDDKVIDGLYEFTLPDNIYEGSSVKVTASFKQKTIDLYTGTGADDKNVTLSEYHVATGDKVTVTPSNEKLKAGYKITKITVTDASGATVAESSDASFTVPTDKNIADNAKLTVKVEMALRAIAIKDATLTNGKVTSQTSRADRGDVVTVTVTPDSDFRVKTGTLKAVIKAKDGSYSSEVFMNRKNDTTYTFVMPSDITDTTKVEVSFTGEFIPGQSDSSEFETSLGTGIAVTVANSESQSAVRGGVTSAGNVNVKSKAYGSVSTESKAGYSKTNTGFAGAIAVQIASLDSKALLYQTADIKLDGELKVSSDAKPNFTVIADASGNKEAGKVGIGAGIAVAVNGSDSFAAVQDGTKLSARSEGKTIRGISVTAEQEVKDTVSAKAGAAGGTAAVPVAAVDVTGSTAVAYIGKVQDTALSLGDDSGLTGNAAVSAKNEASHTISADASAIGKGTGVGVAIAVSVLPDVAEAKLSQSLNANRVTVASETVAVVNETATASAQGGKKSGKSADKKADSMLGTAGKLAGKNKSSSVSGSKVDNAVSNRQQAETSEGSVGVAGAVVVNVQDSESHAEVSDGTDIRARGLVAVTSVNGTTSKVKANASTTNSDIGVGVGAAVNIVTIENTAYLGNGELYADELKVSATTLETTPDADKAASDEVETYDDLAEQLSELVEEYVNQLIKEMGLDQYGLSEDLLGEILGDVSKEVAQTLIDATGLKELLGSGDLSAKYDKAKGLLSDTKDGLMSLPEKLIEPFMEALSDAYDLSDLSSEDLSALKDQLIANFTSKLMEQLQVSGKGVLDGVKTGMIEYLKDNGGDLFSGLFTGHFKENTGKVFSQAKDELSKAVKKQLKNLAVETFKETVRTIDIPGITNKNVDTAVDAFKEIKNAYSAGNIDNILSGVSDYVTDTFRTEVFDYEKMITTLSETDFASKLQETMMAAAKKASVTLTNSAIAALSDHFDLKLEATSDPVGHVIDTQAISGAGTRDVGAAGSVAVTVLNANTSATVAESSKAFAVTGDVTVEAKELRSVKNVASAALDANGDASANKSAEAEANADVAKGNNTVSGNHVTLELGAGASGSINSADKDKNKPVIYITLEDGFELPSTAGYSYTGSDGKEKTGTVKVERYGDGYKLNPKSGDLASLADDVDVRLTLTPKELVNELPDPEVLTDQTLPDDTVTIHVVGREAENGKWSAREGDVIELIIKKTEGHKVTELGYSYTDANGKNHDVEIIAGTDFDVNNLGAKEPAYTLKQNSASQYIYTIRVPKGEITAFVVQIEEGEEDEAEEEASETSAKDGSGKSVGVGAAFSMVYGDTKTVAEVGQRGSFTAGSLTVKAESDHKEDIASAAGSDPLQGEWDADATKDFALDASVALNILDTDVRSSVAAGMEITLTAGDLTVTATENGETETTASAFSVGESTAVGASVALNIANSTVKAELLSNVTLPGSAEIAANSHSEDVTRAIATAMGGDIGRTMAKIGDKADSMETGANKVLDGSYIDNLGKSNKKSTNTNKKINQRLDEKKGSEGKDTNDNASTSSNALRSLGVSTNSEDAGSEGTDEAAGQISSHTESSIDSVGEKSDTKVQVAAAVGVTVASHEAVTTAAKITAGKDIRLTAENTGNFNTMGTGAAMSFAQKANSIALGVAVSVNNNKAIVNANGDLVSNSKGDVTLSARLTQNMDGDFLGKLAAQSLSGSVAGKDSAISLGGAISVVVSHAESAVNTAKITGYEQVVDHYDSVFDHYAEDKTQIDHFEETTIYDPVRGSYITVFEPVYKQIPVYKDVPVYRYTPIYGGGIDITGGKVTIEATDKSKLAARAGGLSLSKGSSVGMGIASTTIVSNNTVTATIGDGTTITADSFKLNAEKLAVTDADFKQLIDLRYLVTDSSELNDEQRNEAKTGLIDVHKGADDESYQVEVNLSEEKLLEAVDALNFLSSQNTYAEAIAGSVATGKTKANLAGSFAVAVMSNDVRAVLGSNVTILTGSGTTEISALDGATSRVIAGSLSAAPAKASVGATVAVLINSDKAEVKAGENLNIQTGGSINIKAEQTGDSQVFTAAMAVATGTQATAAAGGAINVLVNKSAAIVDLGNKASILTDNSNTDIDIHSKAYYDLMLISGSANAVAGTGKVAAGGTVNVIVDKTVARTLLGDGASVIAKRHVNISSDVSDQMISGVLSASVGLSATGRSGAGAVNVIVSKSAAETAVGSGAALNAQSGDLGVKANNDAWMLNATLAAAGSTGTAIGGSFNINVFDREASVNLKNGTLNAGQNLAVQSSGRDTTVLAALAVAGSVRGASVSGNIGVVAESNRIHTIIAEGVTATAGGNAFFETYYSDFTVDAAGTIAASGTSAAVGATLVTVVKDNDIRTLLGASSITAIGGSAVKALSGDSVVGIYVGANAKETQFVGAAGVAVAGGSSFNGAVAVLVNNNTVIADASKATLTSGEQETWKYTRFRFGWRVNGENVEKLYSNGTLSNFRDDKLPRLLSGNLNYLWYDLDGQRYYVDQDDLDASLAPLLNPVEVGWKYSKVRIAYRNNNGAYTGNRNMSGFMGMVEKLKAGELQWLDFYADGIRYRVDVNHIDASLAPLRNLAGINVKADDDTRQLLLAGGVSASANMGAGAAVTTLVSDKTVKALARDLQARGDIAVKAGNRDDMTTVAVNAGISGSAAVQVGAAVQVLSTDVLAQVDGSVKSRDAGVSVLADNDTKLRSIAGAVAGSGSAAVSAVGAVTEFSGSTQALVKEGSTVAAGRDVNVKATANKEINIYSAGVAIGGGVGVSGTANVVVTKDTTAAAVEKDTSVRSKIGALNIETQSDYTLTSATAAIAGGSVAVGVNAVVSVMKSSNTAEMGGKARLGGDLNVKASGSRDVTNAAINLAAGSVGAGVNVMVLVAGEKMSQDAADMLTYGDSKSKTDANKTFDLKKLMARDGLALQYTEYERDANGNYVLDENGKRKVKKTAAVNTGALSDDISGNGHYESQQSVGGKSGSGDKKQGTFDGASGYRSGDFDSDSYNDKGETQRGENMAASDTKDIANAKKLNTYTQIASTDVVLATITQNAVIAKVRNVSVTASQPVTVDLFGVSASGGAVGVGVTTAVAMLHSNVFASSLGNIQNASGSVTVSAESMAGGTVSDQSSALKKVLSDIDPERGGIRVIGASMAAGEVGVAVGAAVLLTDNVTRANLGGNVNAAGAVNVKALHDYGHVTAAVGTLSGGVAAVSASVAVAQTEGEVMAKINDKATVTASGDVCVSTESNVNASAYAATAGAGLVSVNAGVALAINRLTQITGIGDGASVTGKNITVTAISETGADSGLLGVSVGGVGVALGAAVSQVDTTVETEVKSATLTAKGGTVEVSNQVSSTAIPRAISLAGGGVAAGGNVLLAFNNSRSNARVTGSTVTADTFNLAADLKAEASSELTAAQAGLLTVGLSVNYADLQAYNRAMLKDSTVTAKTVTVQTGRNNRNTTTARAETTAGNAGAISVGMNAAIARNHSRSYAVVDGGSITGNTGITVNSNHKPTATAKIQGVSVSGISVAGNTVVALNDAETRVSVRLDTLETGDAAFTVSHDAETTGDVTLGGGAMLEVRTSVAAAYGRSVGAVDANIGTLTAGKLTARTDAKSTTKSTVSNLSDFSAIAAAAVAGVAYSQDMFDTRVQIGKDSTVSGDIQVLDDYNVSAEAEVNPSAGGLDAGLAKVKVNVATARSTAYAGADLILGDGSAAAEIKAKNVTVKTEGSASAKADILPTEITVAAASLGANVAKADLSATQAATIHMKADTTLTASGDVNVKSTPTAAKAEATLGNPGAKSKSVKLSLLNLDLSIVHARENLTSTAAIIGEEKTVTERYVSGREWVPEHVEYFYKYGVVVGSRTVSGYWSDVYATYSYSVPCSRIDCANVNVESAMGQHAGKVRQFVEYYGTLYKVREKINNKWYWLPFMYAMPQIQQNGWDKNPNYIWERPETGKTEWWEEVDAMVDNNTLASASSNGAANVSLLSLGNLEAEATASDNFNTVLQGVTINAGGDAVIRAKTNTSSYAYGGVPGGYSVINGGISNTYANIGSSDDRNTAKLLIGDGVKLTTGGKLDLLAHNQSTVDAKLEEKTAYSVGRLGISSQPTETWLDTGVIIGKDVSLISQNGDLAVTSQNDYWATSIMESKSTGILLNVGEMKGVNTVNEKNAVLIGDNSRLEAQKGVASIFAMTDATVDTETEYKGSFTVIGENGATAITNMVRQQEITLGKNVNIVSGGELRIKSIYDGNKAKRHGDYSSVKTDSTQYISGVLDFSSSTAKLDLDIDSSINIGSGTELTAKGDLEIESIVGGDYSTDGLVADIGSVKLAIVPTTLADIKAKIHSRVNVSNGDFGDQVKMNADFVRITSTSRDVVEDEKNGKPDFERLSIRAESKAYSEKGLFGGATSKIHVNLDMVYEQWIDNTYFNVTGGKVVPKRAFLASDPEGTTLRLTADAVNSGVGKETAEVIVEGKAYALLRTHKRDSVNSSGEFYHTARTSELEVYTETMCNGSMFSIGTRTNRNSVVKFAYCSFCSGTNASGEATNTNTATALSASLSKALAAVNDISRMVNGLDPITKARYGEEDDQVASGIYVLDISSLLEKDVRLTGDQLNGYRLWTDALTQHDVTLLPNATRLYTNAAGRIEYVSEVLQGDVLGNGEVHKIDVITALTGYAFSHPTVPIGSSGSLEMDTGILTVPAQADFELYLNEVSGAWLIEQINSGFIRRLDADQDAINRFARGAGELPEGELVEGLTPDGERGGWYIYWLADTPETAASDDQVLIFLLYNEQTDEIDAYRTSLRMIANGEQPVDVSVYFYRDSRSDRMGIERYNVVFFDTAEGDESLVVLVTDVPEEREMDMPMALEIVLRGFNLGADLPAYSLTGHFFVMLDGSDGFVSMFDGFYEATSDGDTFESDYTRIEGIREGKPEVTIKAGQAIWPEWTGEDTAEDIAGNRFVAVDGVWFSADSAPALAAA